jgi:type I restriction enzyme S subunit
MSGIVETDFAKKTSIGDLPIHIGDGNYSAKYPKSNDFLPSGVPFISASDLENGKIRPHNFRFISSEQHSKLSKGHLKFGDVLIVTRGNGVGGVSFVDKQFEGCNINAQLVLLRVDESELHCRFLYYLLSCPTYQLLLRTFGTGSAQPQIPIWSLKSIELQYPPYSDQRAIAAVLGALDDKIELNRRLNATLEAMARALFESWFVDFDPVRAKLDGRQPSGLDSGIAHLFPNSFQESDCGEVPRGWRCGTVGEIGARILDKVEDQSRWASEALIDLSRMPQRSVALGEWGLGAELTTSVTRFLPKDVLFGAIRPYFHKVGIAPMKGVTNVSVFVIRAKQSCDWPFLAALCSLDSTIAFATQLSKGTKMPVVGWSDFSRYPVVVPPLELRRAFEDIAAPLYERIISNVHQSRTLATLRDALLPKLLSGELSVAAEVTAAGATARTAAGA